MTYAKIIADSKSAETGDRVTTFEVRFHRFILAEVNTHCVLSRNSASSRAIPLRKQLDRVRDDCALPVRWPEEQAGMQGGADLTASAEVSAIALWREASAMARSFAGGLGQVGVHKSVANRLLEPFMWHTAVITGSAWENFFRQRAHVDAQPEFRVLAEAMREAYAASTPEAMQEGEWHLPYVWNDEDTLGDIFNNTTHLNQWEVAAQVSAARCARVSYLTQDGMRDYREDLKLFARLTERGVMHASPLEHSCRVDPWNVRDEEVPLPDGSVAIVRLPRVGKFTGWRQLRHDVELARGWNSFS